MKIFDKILTKEFLYNEYIVNKRSTTSIANEAGCSAICINRRLTKYNIKIRSLREALNIKKPNKIKKIKVTIDLDKDILYKEYIINKKTLRDIANEYNCSAPTVVDRLKKYDIPIRTESEARKLMIETKGAFGKYDDILTENLLYKEYIVNKKTLIKIANELNCSHTAIVKRMKKYGIKIRSLSEATIGKPMPKGKDCWAYGRYKKNPITPINQKLRGILEYKEWRFSVFNRDNFTCQECFKEKSVYLEAHHIKPFAVILSEFLKEYSQYSTLEDMDILTGLAVKYKPFWDIDNGITLCKECHKLTDSYVKGFKKC